MERPRRKALGVQTSSWFTFIARWWAHEQQHFGSYIGPAFSFVMVRHPLDRLVSVYLNKISGVMNPKASPWHKELGDATPTQFLEYVLGRLGNGTEFADPALRPQSSVCPFCAFDWDMVSKKNAWKMLQQLNSL